jgi:hypothetical protein
MEHLSDEGNKRDLLRDQAELRDAVGLELRESTSHNAVERG